MIWLFKYKLFGLLVVFFCACLQAKTVFRSHEFCTDMLQHKVRVPRSTVFVPRVGAGALVEQLAHTRGVFRFVFALVGTRTVVRFQGFAACVTFFRTSKADHLAETSCADKKNLSSSQACALNLMISSMKSARTVNLSE